MININFERESKHQGVRVKKLINLIHEKISYGWKLSLPLVDSSFTLVENKIVG